MPPYRFDSFYKTLLCVPSCPWCPSWFMLLTSPSPTPLGRITALTAQNWMRIPVRFLLYYYQHLSPFYLLPLEAAVSPNLLATKLYIPPGRQDHVPRPRLTQTLDQGWQQQQEADPGLGSRRLR